MHLCPIKYSLLLIFLLLLPPFILHNPDISGFVTSCNPGWENPLDDLHHSPRAPLFALEIKKENNFNNIYSPCSWVSLHYLYPRTHPVQGHHVRGKSGPPADMQGVTQMGMIVFEDRTWTFHSSPPEHSVHIQLLQ